MKGEVKRFKDVYLCLVDSNDQRLVEHYHNTWWSLTKEDRSRMYLWVDFTIDRSRSE